MGLKLAALSSWSTGAQLCQEQNVLNIPNILDILNILDISGVGWELAALSSWRTEVQLRMLRIRYFKHHK